MDTLLSKLVGKVKGVLEGFDRIVFKGMLRPIMFADGAQAFLSRKGVSDKDYKDWVHTKLPTMRLPDIRRSKASSLAANIYISTETIQMWDS
jgi:hypothetical protein